ncbi:MAG: EAL domain-containing protein [Pseudomonadota bacterium]
MKTNPPSPGFDLAADLHSCFPADELKRFFVDSRPTSLEYARVVAKEAFYELGVDRLSVWLFPPDRSSLDCVVCYPHETLGQLSDRKLHAVECPRFFEAALVERVFDASDAAKDERMSEFSASGCAPKPAVSVLVAQIRSAVEPVGIVCAETLETKRDWSTGESAFIASISELLGFSLDRKNKFPFLDRGGRARNGIKDTVQSTFVANERYDLAIKAAYDGVWDLDYKTGQVYFSDQNFDLLGERYDVPPTQFEWWQERVHPEDIDGVLAYYAELLQKDRPYDVTYRMRHRDGSWRWWRSRGKVIRNPHFEPVRIVGTNSDVTDLVETKIELEKRNQELLLAKKKVEHAALHDSLTGLPNRRYMELVSAKKARNAPGKHRALAFLHIDLDNFKEVNDLLGHAAGDEVLCRVAECLKALSIEEDFIARCGGDEFIAILEDQNTAERSISFSEKLIAKLESPMIVEGRSLNIGASVGIAMSEEPIDDASDLLRNADQALYKAKRAGKNTYRVYDHQMSLQAASIRKTKEEIQFALEDVGSFVPFFQAQFYAGSLELAGAEALVRWHHPTRGILSPGEFLQYAEEMNCVAEIDRQVLLKSLATVNAWHEAGLALPRLAVNVSSDRLADPSLLFSLENFEDNVPSLSFELIESTFLDDTSEQVRTTLSQLQDLGIEMEIDDFGSGYASIASLVNIRPKRLKIDKTLVSNVDTDLAMTSLVQSIIDIARTLEVEVIAEGAETPSQIKALTDIGCDILQGYGLARPMSAEKFYKTFANKRTQRSTAKGGQAAEQAPATNG